MGHDQEREKAFCELCLVGNDDEIVEAIALGAPVNAQLRDSEGYALTPLMLLCEKEHRLEIYQRILRAGANPNAIYEKTGESAVEFALHNKLPTEVIELVRACQIAPDTVREYYSR